jgi:hypothetical protein
MRDHIINEIKRLAAESGGSPGKLVFARQTGIKEGQWSGVFWARWSDALSEAGLENNKLQGRFATEDVLDQIAKACRSYEHFPTSAEMKLYRRTNPSFPSHGAIANHFPSRSELLAALIRYVAAREAYQDVASFLPEVRQAAPPIHKQSAEGFVYLLRSGNHYKIGRSDELERRVKEIRISLPEAVSLEHAIKTDDPSGIEAYWHRRFDSLRANGEWFKLGPNELAAFKKRKYQ